MKSVLVVVTTLMLAAPSAAYACSCAIMDVDGARRAAAMVFEGTVERIEPSQGGTAQAVFRVVRVWKGAVQRQVTLRVPAQPSMCPPHFAEGQSYIVYAESSDQGPRVRACARWAQGDGLRRERGELGDPVRTYRRHVQPPG